MHIHISYNAPNKLGQTPHLVLGHNVKIEYYLAIPASLG